MNTDQVLRIFRAIDEKNSDAFVSFISPQGIFKFGNSAPAQGRAAIHNAVSGFFASIAKSEHRLLHVYDDGDQVAVHGEVTYTRKDERKVKVAFVNIFHMKADVIDEYLIHIDNTPLFAP